jgi:hypothetical protein
MSRPTNSGREARLDIRIALAGDDVPEARIAEAARDLLKAIRVDADPHAQLLTGASEPGTKGVVTLGQIALAIVTGGALAKLIESVFGFLGRNRKLVIQIQRADGEKLTLDMDFVNRHGSDSAMNLAEDFLKRGM